jgi:hypothetical protein
LTARLKADAKNSKAFFSYIPRLGEAFEAFASKTATKVAPKVEICPHYGEWVANRGHLLVA